MPIQPIHLLALTFVHLELEFLDVGIGVRELALDQIL